MEQNENKILFTCPNCGKQYRLDEFLTHNSQALNDLINQRTAQELQTKEQNIRNDEIARQQQKSQLEIVKLTHQHQLQLQTEIDQTTKLKTELEKLETNEKLLLENQKQAVAQMFAQQIQEQAVEIQKLKLEQKNQQELAQAQLMATKTQLEQTKQAEIQLLSTQMEAFKAHAASQLETALQKQELALNQKISQLEKEKNELNLANQTNRLINNKVKGENFEHEVEGELRKSFGFEDVIEKITTIDKKADYLQIVRNPNQEELGRIVYEVKNAEWKDGWEEKLVVDTAKQKAKYGILVATSFNSKYHDVPFVKSNHNDHIYLTDPDSFVFVAQILRKMIQNESYYHAKVKELGENSQSQIFEQYKKEHDLLKGFLMEKLPEFKKKFDKQLEDIFKVSQTLIKQAAVLEKAHETLKKEYSKRIHEELQKISTI